MGPLSLFEFLQCPTPFLVGVHSCFRQKALALLDGGADVVQVDLDNNRVSYPSFQSVQKLPPVCRQRILDKMNSLFYSGLRDTDRALGNSPCSSSCSSSLSSSSSS